MNDQPRGAAFFDLDRTLIAGASAFAFARAARDAGLIRTTDFLRDALGAVRFRLSGATDGTSMGVRDRILAGVGGKRREDLVALNEMVLPELLAMIRPEARAVLEQHRAAGRRTFIVSASPVEIVEPLAQALGMTGGIGTRGEVVDGIYTGHLDGPFCYGEGKAEAVKETAARLGIDLDESFAYSDSASDIPMLSLVGNAVAVNPDAHLARVARAKGWPVVTFAQRSKMLIRRSSTATVVGGALVVAYALGLRRGRRT